MTLSFPFPFDACATHSFFCALMAFLILWTLFPTPSLWMRPYFWAQFFNCLLSSLQVSSESPGTPWPCRVCWWPAKWLGLIQSFLSLWMAEAMNWLQAAVTFSHSHASIYTLSFPLGMLLRKPLASPEMAHDLKGLKFICFWNQIWPQYPLASQPKRSPNGTPDPNITQNFYYYYKQSGKWKRDSLHPNFLLSRLQVLLGFCLIPPPGWMRECSAFWNYWW